MPCTEKGAVQQKTCRVSSRCSKPTDFGSATYKGNLTCRVSEHPKVGTCHKASGTFGYLSFRNSRL